MNLRVITLIVAVVVTACVQQRMAFGQTPSPLSAPSSRESEIWHKLNELDSRIAYAEPNAKRKSIDDFIAAEGPKIYQELIDCIGEGFYSRNDLRQVADVMERIKPSPADKLIARINGENDPNQKAMLVYCLGRFDGAEVIATLRKALDETHPLVHPYRSIESAPWPVHRVSDEAYLALLSKVQKSKGGIAASPTPIVQLPRDDQERERRYDELKTQLDTLGY